MSELTPEPQVTTVNLNSPDTRIPTALLAPEIQTYLRSIRPNSYLIMQALQNDLAPNQRPFLLAAFKDRQLQQSTANLETPLIVIPYSYFNLLDIACPPNILAQQNPVVNIGSGLEQNTSRVLFNGLPNQQEDLVVISFVKGVTAAQIAQQLDFKSTSKKQTRPVSPPLSPEPAPSPEPPPPLSEIHKTLETLATEVHHQTTSAEFLEHLKANCPRIIKSFQDLVRVDRLSLDDNTMSVYLAATLWRDISNRVSFFSISKKHYQTILSVVEDALVDVSIACLDDIVGDFSNLDANKNFCSIITSHLYDFHNERFFSLLLDRFEQYKQRSPAYIDSQIRELCRRRSPFYSQNPTLKSRAENFYKN